MPLRPGTRLGPYEVVGPLGAGGMGEVYRAKDTRLDRTVAVKILPPQLAADPQTKSRFEREARAISALNHPHICTLHDIGVASPSAPGGLAPSAEPLGPVHYLVMECVEGETLAKRLEKGPLPLDQVLKYGAQIADAIEKAHRAGIVHRDLKPGNIMLTSAGAKLLDFGLAKPAASLATALTATAPSPGTPVTERGVVVGTFQYMSPEQVEGKDVDGRSDIFSLGAVLYEMATGRRAFEGASQLSVASAILEKDPAPMSSVGKVVPAALDFAVRKCLAKAPEARWQSAADLAGHLTWILESGAEPAGGAGTGMTRARRSWLAWSFSGILAVLLVVAAVRPWMTSAPVQEAMYFELGFPATAGDIAIAPDGRTVAIVAYWEAIRKNVIWIAERGQQRARTVSGTEGASCPFWSPDGRSLAFFADGRLKRLELAGGPAQTICEAPSGRGGTWNKDGVIVFAPTGQLGYGLSRVSAAGGIVTPLTSPDLSRKETNLRWPVFLPDGKHFLYLATNVSGQIDVDAVYEGSLDSNEKKFVVKATGNAVYVAPGYLVYYRDKTLFGQRFDATTLQLSGEPVALLNDVQYLPRIAKAIFSVADGALLLAQSGSGTMLLQPTWFDRRGKELGTAGKPGGDVYSDPVLSPDGRTLAISRTDVDNLNTDVWIFDLQTNTPKRLTFAPAIDAMEAWSPDSTQVMFASNHDRAFDLFLKRTDGAEGERLLLHDDVDKFPNDWSRDGRWVVFAHGAELWTMSHPGMKIEPFLKASGALKTGQFSPDGKWLAYASNESGRWEVYVTSFPAAQGKWQISTEGGEQPKWRGDGKELFYLSADGKIMASSITAGSTFERGAPTELFAAALAPLVATSEQLSYDVTKDGQRFLVNAQVKQAERAPISALLNWTAKLAK